MGQKGKYGERYDMPRGWKTRSPYRERIYNIWKQMWKRVYTTPNDFGMTIHPSFKYFSKFFQWFKTLDNFDEFCTSCNNTKWSIHIDSNINRNFYPESMSIVLVGTNSKRKCL